MSREDRNNGDIEYMQQASITLFHRRVSFDADENAGEYDDDGDKCLKAARVRDLLANLKRHNEGRPSAKRFHAVIFFILADAKNK